MPFTINKYRNESNLYSTYQRIIFHGCRYYIRIKIGFAWGFHVNGYCFEHSNYLCGKLEPGEYSPNFDPLPN